MKTQNGTQNSARAAEDIRAADTVAAMTVNSKPTPASAGVDRTVTTRVQHAANLLMLPANR